VRRGELYRVKKPSARDPKESRVFVVVSRQVLLDSRFSTAVCAPVYSASEALLPQVPVGIEQGLKHNSAIHCDELVSLPKSALTCYIGMLPPDKMRLLDAALRAALQLRE
jgi:mRNA interferase MazF